MNSVILSIYFTSQGLSPLTRVIVKVMEKNVYKCSLQCLGHSCSLIQNKSQTTISHCRLDAILGRSWAFRDDVILHLKIMLLSPSSFCSLHDRPVNWEISCWSKKLMTLIEKPANWGDGRLAFLRTISSQSRFRVLLYMIESGEGLSLALISGRAGLSRLLVGHCPLCGEEGPARAWLMAE